MSIACEVLLRRDASPSQLRELGAALRRWYVREAREHGIALYTNQDGINALRAGQLPQPVCGRRGGRRLAVPFDVRDGKSYSREATIESLRKDIPADLVEDILIDGQSWDA